MHYALPGDLEDRLPEASEIRALAVSVVFCVDQPAAVYFNQAHSSQLELVTGGLAHHGGVPGHGRPAALRIWD